MGICKKVGSFAKRKPSLFIVSLLAVMFIGLFVTYEAFHLTSTAQFCGMCHQDTPHGPGAEYTTWEPTTHALADISCIECHGEPGIKGYLHAKMFTGLWDLYAEIFRSKEQKMATLTDIATNTEHAAEIMPNSTCLYCHSDAANAEIRANTAMTFLGVAMRDSDKVVNPEYREKYGLVDIMTTQVQSGVSMNHAVHVDDMGMSCVTCHTQVAHSGEMLSKTSMQTCFTCHDETRDGETETTEEMGLSMPSNDDCASCHVEALQAQEGEFPEMAMEEPMPWLMESLTGDCGSCHYDAFEAPTAQTCIDCHDESYAELLEMYQADYDAQLSELTPIWVQLVENAKVMTNEQSELFRDFNKLYLLFAGDGSRGVHNPDLMYEVYSKALEKGNELTELLK